MKVDNMTLFKPYSIVIETQEEHESLKAALNRIWDNFAIGSGVSEFDELRSIVNAR